MQEPHDRAVKKIHYVSCISLALIELDSLKPSEDYDRIWAKKLKNKIYLDRQWLTPIWVESHNFIIMDGHHRYQAAKMLHLAVIPCFMLSYNFNYVKLSAWDPQKVIDKNQIIQAALSGKLLAKKTSRHELLLEFPEIKFPLSLLAKSSETGYSWDKITS